MPGKTIEGRLHKRTPYPANWCLEYKSSKGGYRPAKHRRGFSPGVVATEGEVIDVVFEWVESKASNIRLPFEDYESVDIGEVSMAHMKRNGSNHNTTCPQTSYRRTKTAAKRQFFNPYNFIPSPPPPAVQNPLGQDKPRGHDRYHEDLWNGRIEIEIETVTPLLIPDAARAAEAPNGHKTFPLRKKADGSPLLPSTSVKGMLRAAYEAVTNSRFGIFESHEDRLAYRMNPGEALKMIPARVTDDGEKIELLCGTTNSFPSSPGSGAMMYAAWLPRYTAGKEGISGRAVKYPDNTLPQHGDQVWCWLESIDKGSYRYWRVVEIARSERELPGRPSSGAEKVTGWVCITNQNFPKKHDERVFFSKSTAPVVELTDDLKRAWKELVENYQCIHEDDLKKRKNKGRHCDEFLGSKPGESAFSRHICERSANRLHPGDLCYARMDGKQVIGLYPVMIGRELAEIPPASLLPPQLKPAERLDQLSPADRVFGWINQNGQGAWRGCLRVGPVSCRTEDPVESFGKKGLALAILSSPKPQQARFYVARDRCGGAQDDGIKKATATYRPNKGLRGRKVYPHHVLAETTAGYWDKNKAVQDSQNWKASSLGHGGKSLYREYLRRPPKREESGSNRDDQNRSIKEWVKPNVRFSTWLAIENMNEAEVGALLWLLDAGDGKTHRLGGGKPLGFGSVRISITRTALVSGAGRARQFSTLLPNSLKEAHRSDDPQRFIEAFKEQLSTLYGISFEELPFIAAYVKAMQGYPDKPVHYPRSDPRPDPEGNNYEWFTNNERDQTNRLALGNLMDDEGLPYLGRGGNGQRPGGNRQGRGRNRQRPRRNNQRSPRRRGR